MCAEESVLKDQEHAFSVFSLSYEYQGGGGPNPRPFLSFHTIQNYLRRNAAKLSLVKSRKGKGAR